MHTGYSAIVYSAKLAIVLIFYKRYALYVNNVRGLPCRAHVAKWRTRTQPTISEMTVGPATLSVNRHRYEGETDK